MESDWLGVNSISMVVPDLQFIFSMEKKPMALNQIDIVANRSHVTGQVQECLSECLTWPEVNRKLTGSQS